MKPPEWVGNHYMSQKGELILGFILFIVGCWLIWSATDNRGNKLPWPLSGLMPM